MTIENFEPK